MRYLLLASIIFVSASQVHVSAQTRVPAVDATQPATDKNSPHRGADQGASSSYVLGPTDQITLLVADLEEMNNKALRIEKSGEINLPLAGRFHAAGLTINQFEDQIEERLRKYVKDPQVVVTLAEFHSQPVSVLGAVETPGPLQLQGHKTLFEILSEAGGVRSDAGNTINITRSLDWGRLPLPGAKDDPTGKFSIATVTVQSIVDNAKPEENIVVKPYDMISVSRQARVYCVGQVTRPGGFLLGEKESLSTLQVLSLAEGLAKNAATTKAKILRAVPGASTRVEIAINLKQLMAGKIGDLPLKANDILFVPSSAAKATVNRTLEAITQAGTGIAIYGSR